MLPGGGAPEMQVSQSLYHWAKTLKGLDQYCTRAFADALEVCRLLCVLCALW